MDSSSRNCSIDFYGWSRLRNKNVVAPLQYQVQISDTVSVEGKLAIWDGKHLHPEAYTAFQQP